MMIVITRITRDGDTYHVTLVTRPFRKWVIECEASDLGTFKAFHKRCLSHGVSIDHESQLHYPRDVRYDLWDASIAKAMKTGGAGELTDDEDDSNVFLGLTPLGRACCEIGRQYPEVPFWEQAELARCLMKLRRERRTAC